MRSHLRQHGGGYLIAIVATALAGLIRYSLADILGDVASTVPFVLPVVLASWRGGLMPGLLATVLGALASICFFPPHFVFRIERTSEVVAMAFYLSSTLMICGVCESLHAARRRLEAERRGREQDALERARAEEAARQRLEIVTDSMAAPVTRCSRDLRYLWVSQSYARWLGRKPSDFVGRPILEVLGQDAFDAIRPHVERVLAGEKVEYEEQVNYRGAGRRWIHAIYTPTFDEQGTANGWVAVVLDIDQQKRAERDLLEADHRKDEFLALLGHELRNPLAPIRNALQYLRLKGPPDPELQVAREIIDRQVRHMARLVDDLLDVSRITCGKLVIRKERVSLGVVLTNAVEASRPWIEAAENELIVAIPPQPVFLDADLTRLAQVFSNLLNNAAKFTERGRITLSARCQQGQVIVSVKDTGIGIAADQLDRIFEMFSQVAPTPERTQSGLGIGLSLARGLVEMHDGRIEARSDGPGKGSEFVVQLPVLATEREPPLAEDAAVQALHRAQHRNKILLADDNVDAANSLAMVLGVMGHEVRAVYDGLAAVEAARDYRPDLVLLDIGMPRLNGIEAARRIRKLPGGEATVLVAITGWAQDEDKRRSLEAGFDHHLIKPIDPTTLAGFLATLRPVV